MNYKLFKKFKSKAILLVVSLLMLCGALVGCTSTKPNKQLAEDFKVTITDSTGTEINLTKKPEKIVSLAPSTTEILYFLGLEDKIVGRTDYCNFPETIQSVPSVGGTMNPNIEAIVDLAPDLVVASTHVSEEVITKLRETGITVAFLNEQQNFEGTYSTITRMAVLTGSEQKATEVIADMKAKVKEVTEKVENLNKEAKPKVYYAIGYGEYDSTAGGDTFIGEIITLAGGENVAKEVAGWSYSKELLAQNEPDMIIVPSESGIKEGMEATDFYKDLKAVKEGKVYEINGDMISRQGPRVADALVEMAKVINPEMK